MEQKEQTVILQLALFIGIMYHLEMTLKILLIMVWLLLVHQQAMSPQNMVYPFKKQEASR
jgi:hypothetical protein